MSELQAALNTPSAVDGGNPSEYEVVDRLESFIKQAESFGVTSGPDYEEVSEFLEATYKDWAEQQEAEIWAENAWLRHAENIGYDTDGIWR